MYYYINVIIEFAWRKPVLLRDTNLSNIMYRKTPPLRRILFGISFLHKTVFFLEEGGRLKGGVFIYKIIVELIFKRFLYKTNIFPKEGGRLKGGVVLKAGFYGT